MAFRFRFYHSSCTVADDHPDGKAFLPRDSGYPLRSRFIGTSSSLTAMTKLHLPLKPLPYSLRRFPIAFRYSKRLRKMIGILRFQNRRGIHKHYRNTSRTVWENTEKMNETLVRMSLAGQGGFARLLDGKRTSPARARRGRRY
jgi:hypothetical protein